MARSIDTVLPIDDNWQQTFLTLPGVQAAYSRHPFRVREDGLSSAQDDIQLDLHRDGELLTFIPRSRGIGKPEFTTNSIAAAGVFALLWGQGAEGFRDAYLDDFRLPAGFTMTDEVDGTTVKARVHWGAGQWAERSRHTPVLDTISWSHFACATWAQLEQMVIDPHRSALVTLSSRTMRRLDQYRALVDENPLTVARLQEHLAVIYAPPPGQGPQHPRGLFGVVAGAEIQLLTRGENETQSALADELIAEISTVPAAIQHLGRSTDRPGQLRFARRSFTSITRWNWYAHYNDEWFFVWSVQNNLMLISTDLRQVADRDPDWDGNYHDGWEQWIPVSDFPVQARPTQIPLSGRQ